MGSIEDLLGILRVGHPEQGATARAAERLIYLVRHGQAAAVAEAGAAEALVRLLRAGEPKEDAVANAVSALSSLALNGQAAAVAEAGAVEALVGVLRAEKPEQEATDNAVMALAMLLHSGQVGPMAETDEVVKLVVEVVRILVEDLRLGQLDQKITLHAASMLGNLAEMGQAVAIVKEGAVEALVKLMSAGELEQKLTTSVMSALANLAVHESLRATLRRAGVLEPLAHKLNTGGLAPQAHFSGLTAVAMLYGEDATNEAVNALLSSHNVAVLAVAVMRSALEETVCNELNGFIYTYSYTLRDILPRIRSMSVHAQTRDQLLEAGAAPLVIQAANVVQSPVERLHAVRCLFNFAWAGPAAVESLKADGAVEVVRPWAEADKNDDNLLELHDAAQGLLRALGAIAETAAAEEDDTTQKEDDEGDAPEEVSGSMGHAAAIPEKRYEYGVFLSHKQSDAKDFARSLFTLIEGRGVKCFLDMDFRGELNDLELIVSTARTLIFVLSDNVFDSEWCIKELAAAVRHGVKVVFVLKEGARWADKDGNYVCTFPPDSLIRAKVPAEAMPAFSSKAINHSNDYYAAFAHDLLQRIDAQQEQIDSLRGYMAAAAVATATSPAAGGSGAAALAQAHAALEAHLVGVYPGLVTYMDALIELGVDTIEALTELDEESIDSLNLKKMHRAKFLKACGM